MNNIERTVSLVGQCLEDTGVVGSGAAPTSTVTMNNISLRRGWRLSRLGRLHSVIVLLTVMSVAQLASAFGLYVRVLASGVASTTIRYDMIR